MKRSIYAQGFALAAAFLLSAIGMRAADTFKPGDLWPDDQGKHIQAHGGGVIQLGDTYYWFGEDRAPENGRRMRCVSCYASKDLLHWTHRAQVFKTDHLEELRRVIFHGVLHLMGYKDKSRADKETMRSKENEWLRRFKTTLNKVKTR